MSAPGRPSVGKPLGPAQALAIVVAAAQAVEDERLVTKQGES